MEIIVGLVVFVVVMYVISFVEIYRAHRSHPGTFTLTDAFMPWRVINRGTTAWIIEIVEKFEELKIQANILARRKIENSDKIAKEDKAAKDETEM